MVVGYKPFVIHFRSCFILQFLKALKWLQGVLSSLKDFGHEVAARIFIWFFLLKILGEISKDFNVAV